MWTCGCEEHSWGGVVIMGVYVIEDSTHVLAITGHKHPDGEKTPDGKTSVE